MLIIIIKKNTRTVYDRYPFLEKSNINTYTKRSIFLNRVPYYLVQIATTPYITFRWKVNQRRRDVIGTHGIERKEIICKLDTRRYYFVRVYSFYICEGRCVGTGVCTYKRNNNTKTRLLQKIQFFFFYYIIIIITFTRIRTYNIY